MSLSPSLSIANSPTFKLLNLLALNFETSFSPIVIVLPPLERNYTLGNKILFFLYEFKIALAKNLEVSGSFDFPKNCVERLAKDTFETVSLHIAQFLYNILRTFIKRVATSNFS